MQLEDYFEFLDPDDIRIKGHRIGIDDVIDYYLQGYTPEQILEDLPSLDLEKIHATKYLSKINLTFLEKRKISVFLICSLFPVPCSL